MGYGIGFFVDEMVMMAWFEIGLRNSQVLMKLIFFFCVKLIVWFEKCLLGFDEYLAGCGLVCEIVRSKFGL